MTSYDFDSSIESLRQAVDFAEIEGDFVPLRKWANEVAQSGHELGAMDGRLNRLAGKEALITILQPVACGAASPEEALLRIRRWLNSGQSQTVETQLTHQYQLA